MDIADILNLDKLENGTLMVRSRERRDLEFKQTVDENQIRKCLRTIAAYANTAGGRIIFGVTDRNRQICGIPEEEIPDPARLDDLLVQHLSPVPDIRLDSHEIDGLTILEIYVSAQSRPPVIAIKTLQTAENNNRTVLQAGCVYYRRSGKTFPAGSNEFLAMMERRDESVRNSILGLIRRAGDVGYDNVAVANLSEHQKAGDNVTLYVPEEAAKKLNIIDRAKLVESEGAPAYEIKGGITISTFSDKDPRKPMLPQSAARALRPEIRKIFWDDFPWSEGHLRRASTHLGHWDKAEGDGTNTAIDELTQRRKYLDRGRLAVLGLAQSDPDTFVDVVGSRESVAKWNRIKDERQNQ